jgi:transcription initiation factor TFIIE subunit beta
MSSYHQKQQDAFRKEMAAASSRMATKPRPQAPIPSAPSPAPSTSSTSTPAESQKRKRETQPVVYSQPAETGYGNDSFTQVTYIIEFLKKKGEAKTFNEILQYLSQMHCTEQQKRTLAGIMRKHGRIQWIPDESLKQQPWSSGKFKHRPIIDVRTKDQLLAYLQRKADAQGVSVKDLKDGWPDCEGPISELERVHKLLVTRTKKDGHARMVWANDSSLYHNVEPEFVQMWQKIELPAPDDLVRKLIDAGQKPASEDPSKRVKAAPKTKEKKKRPPRKGGRTTNVHMEHLLRDYDHLKR